MGSFAIESNLKQVDYYSTARQVFSDEITSLNAVLEQLESSFNDVVELLLTLQGKVVVTGLGKSGLVGSKIAATLASTGTPAIFMNAAEALHGDLGYVSPGDAVLMLSNSGSTVELVKMLPTLERLNTPVIGIFGKVDTPLARRCHHVLNATIEKEACPLNLAPMTSTTCALVIGDALAAAMMKARDFRPDEFALRHPGGALGVRLLLKVKDLMHSGDELPRISPHASFRDVIAESTRPNLGAVCVVDADGILLGIVTDGDVRRSLLNDGVLNSRAEEIMTKDPVSIEIDASINAALELMESRKIYVLPVIDGPQRKLLGLLRMHDVFADSSPKGL
ncbi:KpsF/GutQ family sugar-phosphate isomerase [Cerasicoccus frondis]|uniref:KpsF/GutQ family sugar-phosphate isomerase n=1 Tax=Cerasicoccus frondis TaxID=490090 RepID=UPI002852D444|nr:KpsF/GutQ family sugar-phosphate isomerase [Cerasicoccus frondis]